LLDYLVSKTTSQKDISLGTPDSTRHSIQFYSAAKPPT